jgi:hypothetical protein
MVEGNAVREPGTGLLTTAKAGDRMIIKLAMMAAVYGVMLVAPVLSARLRSARARRHSA